jgi:hypothetical protein
MFKSIVKSLSRKIKNVSYLTIPFKVNLFIVGEQKCGTTSLHNLLCQSKKIVGANNKELHFFDAEDAGNFSNEKYRNYQNKFKYNIIEGLPKYAIDSTPSYAWKNNAMKHIKKYNSEAKIIYLTRDPVLRFISAYSFYKKIVKYDNPLLKISESGRKISDFLKQNPDFTIDNFFEIETSNSPIFYAIERGVYKTMKKEIESHFSSHQIFYSTLEKLSSTNDFSVEITRMEEFLGLPIEAKNSFPQNNISGSFEEIVPEYILSWLREYYRSDAI